MLKTIFEILDEFKYEVSYRFYEDPDYEEVPLRFKGIIRPAGKYLYIWDDVGNLILTPRGFIDNKCGTILYLVD